MRTVGSVRLVFAFALHSRDDFAPAISGALGSFHMACEHTDLLETFSEYAVFISGRLPRAVRCLPAGIGHRMFGHARVYKGSPGAGCAGRDTWSAMPASAARCR
jgi:hypothetical protein